MKKILILAGPSAVGKTTVMKEILSNYSEFEFIRSATTRAKRGDGHDSEYIYLTECEFRKRIADGGMLEYTEYGGNLYGTPASEIERIFESGKIPLLILDINGVISLKGKKHSFTPYAVYITGDVEVLDSRLKERAEKDGFTDKALATFERRKAQNRADFKRISELPHLFDFTVKNESVQKTAATVICAFHS